MIYRSFNYNYLCSWLDLKSYIAQLLCSYIAKTKLEPAQYVLSCAIKIEAEPAP